MKMVNIQAAEAILSQLVEEAVAGEEVILAKAGRPLVRLAPCAQHAQPRILGLPKGRIREAEGCWAPDSALEAEFENNPATLSFVPRPR
jgi:prevent-host-death family protein